MNLTRVIALLAAIVAGAGSAADGPAPNLKSGIDAQNFDSHVRPQDDFYHYVNGEWLNRNPIPADAVRISAASQVNDATREQLKTIVTEAGSNADTDQRKIADLYLSFMDEPAAERLGIRPLRADLARIDAIRTQRDVARMMGTLGQIGVRTPVGNSILNDSRDAGAYVQSLYQWGLGLPGREYYVSDEAALREIRAHYRDHISRLLSLAGDAAATENADCVVALETHLAQAQWSIADSSDPVKIDNRFTLEQLQTFAPGLDWNAFLVGNLTPGRADAFIVNQPDYFRALAQLTATTPLPAWKAYFRYQLLIAYAPFLGKAFVDEGFSFESQELRGIRENSPRWKRGVNLVEESMGEALGRLYVSRYVSPKAKERVAAMLTNFIAAFDQNIDSSAWMSADTRQRAKEKLVNLRGKIAWPDHWRDYETLRIARGDLVGNVQRARGWEYRRNMNKLGHAVNRDEWYMTPQTPDAYEWAPQNEIVIGAALLHPPFFDPDADDAVNYGSIGGTIGHEISHGFDNIGSQYDARGKLLGKPGWFTPEDQQRFDALTQALVAQYSAFEPLPGYRVDGTQTLSENIADVSGAAIAYRAWKLSLGGRAAPVIDGLTGDQRFFIGWAQRRRGNYRERELIRIIKSDEHSPPEVRAVAPLMNLDAFHEAFGIRPGDRMYLPPEKRVRVW